MKRTLMSISVFTLVIFGSVGGVAADSTYCVDNSTLHIKADPNITISGTVMEFEGDNIACQHGCNNESWLGLGTPACGESPLLSLIIAVLIVMVMIYVLTRWFQ